MITPANFNLFVSTVNTLINEARVRTLPLIYPTLCEEMPSGTTQNVYGWIGRLPKMRKWDGARVVFESAPQTYTLVNQAFESTLAIDRFRLDDDQFGLYYKQIPFMTEQARMQPDYMLRDLIENVGDQTGTLQNGLDGLPGFSTAHPVDFYNAGAGTYSNDFVGGFGTTLQGVGYTVGGALSSPGAFWSAYEYMMSYKGEDGEPLGVVPDTLMCSQFLKGEAEILLKNSFYSPPAWGFITGQVGAAENPVAKWGMNLVINPLLVNYPLRWYLACTTRPFRPFIHQRREATQMVPRVTENDPVVFNNHTFLWGQWDRQAVGWGPSFLVARSGPS